MSPPAAVRGRVDLAGRLVAADPALEALQREAGSALGDPLALPPLDALARLARRLGIPIARPVRVADGEFDLHLYVRASPGPAGTELVIASWDSEPLRSPRADGTPLIPDRVRAAADWTWESDARLVITAVSPQTRWQLGLPAEHIVGQPLTALFRLEEVAGGQLPLLLALAGQVRVDAQLAELRTAPHHRYRLSAQPLFDPDGHFAGFRGAAVRVMDDPVPDPVPGSGSLSVGERLGDALRAPLAAIVREADALRAGDDGPLRRDYADYAVDIGAAARHLLALVDDLVDLDAVERPDFRPEREPVDLAEVARRAVALFAVRAAASEVSIERPDSGLALQAMASHRHVLQIAVNLIGNAVRHAARGGTVRVTVDHAADNAWLSVADDGGGIDPADQERVFEKFVRLDPQRGEGSGLGLHISRRLARAMGGDLLLESRLGAGALFTLRLPAA